MKLKMNNYSFPHPRKASVVKKQPSPLYRRLAYDP